MSGTSVYLTVAPLTVVACVCVCVSGSSLVGSAQAQERVHSLILSRAFEKLVDFDNHLDNIEMDWTNPSVNQALESSSTREE